ERSPDSFCIVPGSNETDLRSLYCAFAISAMLDDWSAIDMRRAIGYIASCRVCRSQIVTFSSCGRSGGTTYIAIGSLHLVSGPSKPSITPTERQLTIGFVSRSLRASCRSKYSGIAKAPREHHDSIFFCSPLYPYHTYLSLAVLSMYSPAPAMGNHVHAASWTFEPLDPLLNAREETAWWVKK
ncbi:Geranylgeranyl transferase type-1 subunit beta, partial [Termitomyces sp. J132]